MDKYRQDLIQAARHKLERAHYSVEQRELILRTLDLLLDLAHADERTEENARSTSRLFANITNHHNLLAIIHEQGDELNSLKRITVNLTSSLQMQVILDAIATEALRLIKNARDVHIFLYQDGQLQFASSLDSDGKHSRSYTTPRRNGLTQTVVQTRQVIVVDDISRHPLFHNAPPGWTGGIVGIPLLLGGNVVGVMNMTRWSSDGFDPSELRLLGLLADQAALAIMNARLHSQVSNLAMSDALTGLPNRRALDARLEEDVIRSTRYHHEFAVLLMDLDGFKAINDTYGHSTGDDVLRQYAQFMVKQPRASDFLARYGGDELLMILPETNLQSALLVAEHIRERMSAFEVALPDGTTRALGISGGISIFPDHAVSASDLLRAADEALYHAKRTSRGSFFVADPGGELYTSPGKDPQLP